MGTSSIPSNISKFLEIRLTIAVARSIFTVMKLDDAAARLEALGNPTRLKIYRTLVRAGAEGMPVGRLTQAREGTTLYCHANYELMRGLIEYMVEECCAEGTCAPAGVAKLPKVA